MALESPLFQSSMELLGHSVTHFVGQEELDRKIFILHVCNAIELLLKDILLDTGKSIYKSPKETVTIWGCIDELEKSGFQIPYKNKIELLIDERNALQHRFGSPNELTTIFYQAIAFQFFRDVLKSQYSVTLDEVLEQFSDKADLASLRVREPSNDSELEKLRKLSSGHPLAAFLAATSFLERTIRNFLANIGFGDDRVRPGLTMNISYRRIEQIGIEIPTELRSSLDQIRNIRNQSVHGQTTPTPEQVSSAIDAIAEFERFLDGVDREKAHESAKRFYEQLSSSKSFSFDRQAIVLRDTADASGATVADNSVQLYFRMDGDSPANDS